MEAIVGYCGCEGFGVALGTCSQRSDNAFGNALTRRIAMPPQHSQSTRQGLSSSLIYTAGKKRLSLASAVQDDRNVWGSDDGMGANAEFQVELERVMQEGDAPRLMEKLQTAEDRVLRAEAARKLLEEKLTEVANMKAELARASEEAELEEADEGVTAAARLVAEAEAEVALRREEVLQARAKQGANKWSTPGVDEDKERIESGKAAAIAVATGLAASLPVVLAGRGPESSLVSLVVSEGAILATCALFGVCYRYMIRRDTQNTHLKGGVVAAFGLTRGLAQVATTSQLAGSSPAAVETLLKSALDAGESVIFLAFAAAALDFCMQTGRLNAFPSVTELEDDTKS
ncbi:hypothetical protein KFL_000970300 [Klebsormidium nitens]|uniref:Uncharacterized protein n=1 Tax=Klebsormidium nitens TaxID=105231 RepID=A0A0U9HRV6_KLENI|nr:hypothetical protein KFL_000970300 [Klebsormidium nitens]|eukprot:GAQ82004.1 hypothetical protein KFL_000970300 [Klebsormidium nitens]